MLHVIYVWTVNSKEMKSPGINLSQILGSVLTGCITLGKFLNLCVSVSAFVKVDIITDLVGFSKG